MRSTTMAAGQWSELPDDLLEMMAKRLPYYADYIRVRAVCSSWTSALPKKPVSLRSQFPLLMLPYQDDDKDKKKKKKGKMEHGKNIHDHHLRSFFSLLENKFYDLEIPEEARGNKCRGSSYGWIVVEEKGGSTLSLINPFTRAQILLPSKSSFTYVSEDDYDGSGSINFTIDKVILCSPPVGSDYMAMAIYGDYSRLAFCRSGDEAWTFVYGERTPHMDILLHRGKFYASRDRGEVVVLEMEDATTSCVPKFSKILPKPHNFRSTLKTYLVSSSDEELLMVARYGSYGYHYKTVGFRVYKLDESSNGCNPWSAVNNLGDRMLFVGLNSSQCFSSLDFPGSRGNCIYFTDDYVEAHEDGLPRTGQDTGVFSLEDGTIIPLPGYKRSRDTQFILPSTWVIPNPC